MDRSPTPPSAAPTRSARPGIRGVLGAVRLAEADGHIGQFGVALDDDGVVAVDHGHRNSGRVTRLRDFTDVIAVDIP